MYLNNYQYLKKKESFILIFLILISLFVRIPVILIFGDNHLENEWKTIVENLVRHDQFSYRSFDGYFLPNLYMPPLYSFFLYSFTVFDLEQKNYILLILSTQAFLSSISVIVFYKLNKILFSQTISFFGSLILSFFPLYIYACSQISSASLQVFLSILFIYLFLKFVEKRNILLILSISSVSGLLILLRGEFIAIFILSLVYAFLFFKIPLKKILLIILITLVTISPYLIRNIIIFEKITITKSFGYNLWKGNNPNAKVEGSELIDTNLQTKINKLPEDKYYQINLDKIFFDQAIKNITSEPTKYLLLSIKRFFSFIFIDIESSNPKYYNPAHYLPVLLIALTSLIGIFLQDKKSYKFNYLILIFLINIFIYSFLFILARYKLAILPLQIIFTNTFLEYLKKKFSAAPVKNN